MAVGSALRANGECRRQCLKTEGAATSDLLTEMNLTEIQKLKQQLIAVSSNDIILTCRLRKTVSLINVIVYVKVN